MKNHPITIHVAKSAGFCFGVKRAINIALKAAGSESTIEMLGDIVHNEDVVNEMKNAGIQTVKELSDGKNKTLLVRAHGVPLKTLQEAAQRGYKIIDATCPRVKDIQSIAVEMENQYEKIIIIGDKKHAEVQGIIGHLSREPLVINEWKNVSLAQIKSIHSACVVVQSTQNVEKVNRIVSKLEESIPHLKFYNTICATTRRKQSEIQNLPLKNDLVLIIGSKNSANTKRLYEISKGLNPRSYWIQSPKDIQKKWFDSIQKVGITAGASTPDYTIEKVIERVKEIASGDTHRNPN